MRMIGNTVVLICVMAWVFFIIAVLRPQAFLLTDTAFIFTLIIAQSFLFVSFSKGILNQTYWVFSLLFFGIVPILEIESGVRSYVGMPALSDADLIVAGIYVFIFNFIYALTYLFKKAPRKSVNMDKLKNELSESPSNENLFFIIGLFVSSLCFVIVWQDLGGSQLALIYRGGEFVELASDWGPMKLLIQRFIRPIPVVFLTVFILVYGFRSSFKLLILFSFCLLVAFPTSLPRFVAAALYIPLLFVIVPFLYKGLNYFYFLIVSILFLFPTLNSFRRYSLDNEGAYFKIADLSFFTEGHFDSFQTFAQVVANNLISYGEQFLLTFLFWIPRSVWEGKPVSSGVEIATELGAYFTNISANIYAEGWINFGFFGAMFFALGIGFFNSKYDKKFFGLLSSNSHLLDLTIKKRLLVLLYFIMGPMLFITLRGDLVTGVANTGGMVGAWYFVYRLALLICVRKRN